MHVLYDGVSLIGVPYMGGLLSWNVHLQASDDRLQKKCSVCQMLWTWVCRLHVVYDGVRHIGVPYMGRLRCWHAHLQASDDRLRYLHHLPDEFDQGFATIGVQLGQGSPSPRPSKVLPWACR